MTSQGSDGPNEDAAWESYRWLEEDAKKVITDLLNKVEGAEDRAREFIRQHTDPLDAFLKKE